MLLRILRALLGRLPQEPETGIQEVPAAETPRTFCPHCDEVCVPTCARCATCSDCSLRFFYSDAKDASPNEYCPACRDYLRATGD